MRLAFKDLRMVSVRAPDEETRDRSVYHWRGEPTRLAVKLQPTGFHDSRMQVMARLAGEAPEKSLVMYYAGIARLEERMGVCVDTAVDAPCDYRIVGVENWPGHRRAYLAYIPENRRGD